MFARFLRIGLLIAGGALSVASHQAADGKALIKRATFDLQCPKGNLRWTKIDERTWAVTGCGKRGTYIETCDGKRSNPSTQCTWVMNTGPRR